MFSPEGVSCERDTEDSVQLNSGEDEQRSDIQLALCSASSPGQGGRRSEKKTHTCPQGWSGFSNHAGDGLPRIWSFNWTEPGTRSQDVSPQPHPAPPHH